MNRAFCNKCGKLVPASREERDGRVFMIKVCPACGRTDTVISNDAERYRIKRSLDGDHDYAGCALNCLDCKRKNVPTFVFMDITNRCNSNCPICINNTPSMGFLFEPPMEYFERVLRHYAAQDPRPAVQLFGGEPTVRDDLFEIIRFARSCGLPTRVVTNGLKLADEDYCRRLVQSRATILIAYDGSNPQTYKVLRGNANHLRLKQKAFENIRKVGGGKVAIMCCLAKGFNEEEIPELVRFCHERREFIRGIYFLPLAQTWELEDLPLEPERMTTEDIEVMFNDCFPSERIDFVPAGVLGELGSIMKCLGIKPPPFAGAHPNCESMYLLISNGERYLPLVHYLKGSVPDLVRGLFAAEKRLSRLVRKHERSLFGRVLSALRLKKGYLAMRAAMGVVWTLRRHLRLGRIIKGGRLGKVRHTIGIAAGLLSGARTATVLERHTNCRGVLQIIVLPFEDKTVLETDRLERCPNAFVFYDPRKDKVVSVPTCAWGLHKTPVLRDIAEFYSAREPAPTASGAQEQAAEEPAG